MAYSLSILDLAFSTPVSNMISLQVNLWSITHTGCDYMYLQTVLVIVNYSKQQLESFSTERQDYLHADAWTSSTLKTAELRKLGHVFRMGNMTIPLGCLDT